MTSPRFDSTERAMIRAAVETYRSAQAAGTPADANLNLAAYAAEILPKLCDRISELEMVAAYHQRQHHETYRELAKLRGSEL